jgi:hypothetical protein
MPATMEQGTATKAMKAMKRGMKAMKAMKAMRRSGSLKLQRQRSSADNLALRALAVGVTEPHEYATARAAAIRSKTSRSGRVARKNHSYPTKRHITHALGSTPIAGTMSKAPPPARRTTTTTCTMCKAPPQTTTTSGTMSKAPPPAGTMPKGTMPVRELPLSVPCVSERLHP